MIVKSSMVKMIEVWSETAGLPILTTPKIPNEARCELAQTLIIEELCEFTDATTLEDKADALGDLLWVTIRAMMEYGIDSDKVVTEIYKSNMSKFDSTLKESAISIKLYEDKEIETYAEKVNDLYVIKRVSDNKILKSHKFKKPDFSSLYEPNI